MDFRPGTINDKIPLVTIGVLSYNYSAYVLAALNSLITQTYSNIELIIIDDKSTESTPDIIEKWIAENKINCVFIKNEINIGITKVSNKIVGLTNGKYISLFAIDDIMLPEKIERQVKAMEEAGEDFGMCYANVNTMDEKGNFLGHFVEKDKFVAYNGDILKPYVFGQLNFATPGSLIRTSVYKTTGLYDERVLYEDYNFWLRLFACFKAVYCEYPCLIYRVRKASELFNTWTKNNNELYHRDRILSNHQALKFIDDPEVINFLKKKITQYLKSLSAQNSAYTKDITIYLIKKMYWSIPFRVILKLLVGR